MALKFNVISADDHVQEPPDCWTSRLSSSQWGDQIPQVVKRPDGNERWSIGGEVKWETSVARTGALATPRSNEPQHWAEVPKPAHDPEERLVVMDQDGIDAQVLYPSAAGLGGELFSEIRDPALEVAATQAYNDWILETWGAKSPRFLPQCIVPVSSVEAAKTEAARALGKGHRGVVMTPFPWHVNESTPHLHDRVWDPFWAVVQDADVPICFHSGTTPRMMLEGYEGFNAATARGFENVIRPISSATAVISFLLSGILERFPKMKIVFSASTLDWVPFQLELADHEWRTSMLEKEGVKLKPTELFHRQCYVTTWFDKAGLMMRDFLGVGNILWQSEFPLGTSTYPNSADFIQRNFEGIEKADRDRILYQNAAELYKVQV